MYNCTSPFQPHFLGRIFWAILFKVEYCLYEAKKEASAFLCFILKYKIVWSLSCLPLLCLRLQTDADATQESKELKSSELCSRPTCIFPSLWLQKENYPTQQIVLPNINKYGNNIFLGFINFIKTQLSLNIPLADRCPCQNGLLLISILDRPVQIGQSSI